MIRSLSISYLISTTKCQGTPPDTVMLILHPPTIRKVARQNEPSIAYQTVEDALKIRIGPSLRGLHGGGFPSSEAVLTTESTGKLKRCSYTV